jgi:5'-methylthioadenosine phosphorylase
VAATGEPRAQVGVFGGSGFYSFLDDVEEVTPTTPFGAPSAPLTVGTVGDTRVAFLPRHGRRHEHAPAQIPARANLWAMRMLGVRTVVGPCAVGSLRLDVAPGHFVVLDQLVDRTRGRDDTFYDRGLVHHVSFADPYCPVVRERAIVAAEGAGVTVHHEGTIVVINGPRFSTRAESRWYRSQGWDVVGMTQHPEAYLARELGMHYAGIALVTDYDTGVEEDPDVEPVTQEQVLAMVEQNVDRVRAVLFDLLPTLATEPTGCTCAAAVGPLHPYE